MKQTKVALSLILVFLGFTFFGPALEAGSYVSALFLVPAVSAPAIPWNEQMVGADQAEGFPGCPGAIVAVLDTGLWPEAPGLAGVRIVPGYDFVNQDSDPRDNNGHGTHIASLIHRLCPDCPILPVK